MDWAGTRVKGGICRITALIGGILSCLISSYIYLVHVFGLYRSLPTANRQSFMRTQTMTTSAQTIWIKSDSIYDSPPLYLGWFSASQPLEPWELRTFGIAVLHIRRKYYDSRDLVVYDVPSSYTIPLETDQSTIEDVDPTQPIYREREVYGDFVARKKVSLKTLCTQTLLHRIAASRCATVKLRKNMASSLGLRWWNPISSSR